MGHSNCGVHMKKSIAVLALAFASVASAQTPADVAAWEKQAKGITITRDDWGIAHVHGKTDADAVFGMIYAQAEDDFNRVETNFINSMGRLAEAEGEKEIYRDLRMKLFINPDSMKVKYAASEPWLKKLCVAWADGLNFYLYKHPEVKPRVITKFEPWMALTFSEGSIGGDIEKVNLDAARGDVRQGGRRHEPGVTGRRGRLSGTEWLERHRDRAVEHAEPSCAAVDQPAHVVLLPLGTADDERRRVGCVRRGDVGTVLHLSGLQQAHRMDAHDEWRERPERIRRDGGEEG